MGNVYRSELYIIIFYLSYFLPILNNTNHNTLYMATCYLLIHECDYLNFSIHTKVKNKTCPVLHVIVLILKAILMSYLCDFKSIYTTLFSNTNLN